MPDDCINARTIQNVKNRLAILPSFTTPPVASSTLSPHFRTPSGDYYSLRLAIIYQFRLCVKKCKKNIYFVQNVKMNESHF
jgi:hypothetical protein